MPDKFRRMIFLTIGFCLAVLALLWAVSPSFQGLLAENSESRTHSNCCNNFSYNRTERVVVFVSHRVSALSSARIIGFLSIPNFSIINRKFFPLIRYY